MITPVPSASTYLAIAATSALFDVELEADAYYLYVASVATWIAQGTDPTAAVDDQSMFVPASTPITLAGATGAKVAAIRAAGDGGASLTRLRV